MRIMTQPLTRITHGGTPKAEKAIIWMHGLGADMHDFEPILPHLKLAPTTRVIFPQAPIRSITVNNGYPMPGWYDIKDFNLRDTDKAGIAESAEALTTIYQAQIQDGITPENILFAGFSQGGVMALHLGLRHPCAGILALSCYLAEPESIPHGKADFPILQLHGRHDPIVAYALGETAHQTLINKGYAPQWRSYDMGHEVCPEEIHDIATWLHALHY